jgi:excisionase family DNA binding protein
VQNVDTSELDLLDVKQAGRRMNLNPETVRRMCLRGELASIKVGRRRLIPPAAITEWIAGKLAEARNGDAA